MDNLTASDVMDEVGAIRDKLRSKATGDELLSDVPAILFVIATKLERIAVALEEKQVS